MKMQLSMRRVGWAAALCLGAAGLLAPAAVAAPHSRSAHATVTASMFPAASCEGGNAKSGLAGSYLSCEGVNDWWDTSAKPYTIDFGGYVNASGPATGRLVFEEWAPTGKKPIYRYNYGVQHLGYSGEWFQIPVKALRAQPGDYYAALYFNGQEIGWTPVNMTAPGANVATSSTPPSVVGAMFPAASCTNGPAQEPYIGYYIRCNGLTDWWAASQSPYTVTFDGLLNTPAPTSGTLELVESAPGTASPVYQDNLGTQQVTLSGEWFRVEAQVLRNAPGDYLASLYFNGKLVGTAPVNVTAPGGQGPGRRKKHRHGRKYDGPGHGRQQGNASAHARRAAGAASGAR